MHDTQARGRLTLGEQRRDGAARWHERLRLSLVPLACLEMAAAGGRLLAGAKGWGDDAVTAFGVAAVVTGLLITAAAICAWATSPRALHLVDEFDDGDPPYPTRNRSTEL